MLTRKRITTMLAGALLLPVAVVAAASPATADGQGDPPGNNGTIKIDDVEFDDHPNNEPHVGCVFQVDFYGYDEGDLHADVTFRAHPPTLRDGDDQILLSDTVFIGEDDKSGGGSQAGLDASETYVLDLTGITPHPQQGFHVKLTINAEGSQGADTKHKVFWVQGCDVPTEKPSNGTTPSDGDTTPADGDSTPPNGTPGGNGTAQAAELPKTGVGFPTGKAALLALFLVCSGALLAWRGAVPMPYLRRH